MKKLVKILFWIILGVLVISLLSSLFPKQESDNVNLATNNFPDPTGIFANETYYAYSTSSNGLNIPLATSKKGISYTINKDALPQKPSWSRGSIWAPHIAYHNNKYFLYFSALNVETNKRCIGVAVSDTPGGVFEAKSQILVSANRSGGVIDPSTFTDNKGQQYLLYKNDGNSIKQPSSIWIQKLQKDGLKVEGKPQKILSNLDVLKPENKNEVVSTIEAPNLVQAPDGTYILLFSGNAYTKSDYFTGYASSRKLLGSYNYCGPLLTTESLHDRIIGPGGSEVVYGKNKRNYLLLHGWDESNLGSRKLYILNFFWKKGHIPTAD